MRVLLKDLVNSGKPVIQVILQMPSLEMIELLAAAGVNHIIIDNEHTYTTSEQTVNMIRTCDSVGVAASVRIASVSEDAVKKVLDMGASGIVLPNLSTPEQVHDLLRFAKHPPSGIRGACPYTRANNYGVDDTTTYYARANDETFFQVMVEDPVGVANLEEIMKLEGLHCVWIGAVDLSIYLGYPGQTHHDEILSAIDKLMELSEKYGKYISITAYNPQVDIPPFKARKLLTTYMLPKPEPFIISEYKKICDTINQIVSE